MIKGYSEDVFKSVVDRFIGLNNKAEKNGEGFRYQLQFYDNRLEITKFDNATYKTIDTAEIIIDNSIFDWLDKEEQDLRFPKKEEIYK